MGFPQVGTSHVLRICAVLKSPPSESRHLLTYWSFFSPPSGFPVRAPGLVYILVHTHIIPEYGQSGYEMLCFAEN